MMSYAQDREDNDLERLVVLARGGDREAFGKLFEQFQPQIHAIALRRLGDFAEAQEVCQDVFVQAMLKLEQLRDPSCFPAWLRAITGRMVINRRTRRRPVYAAEPEVMESHCVEARTPLNDALEQERATQVHAGLNRLGDLDQETLEAFYMQGQSLREMSVAFDAPLGTIKRRLHTARKRLSDEVGELMSV